MNDKLSIEDLRARLDDAQLHRAGYDVGDIDGALGKRTKAALNAAGWIGGLEMTQVDWAWMRSRLWWTFILAGWSRFWAISVLGHIDAWGLPAMILVWTTVFLPFLSEKGVDPPNRWVGAPLLQLALARLFSESPLTSVWLMSVALGLDMFLGYLDAHYPTDGLKEP